MNATRVKVTKRAPRANWRGRNQAAWRDLLHPEAMAKILGKPVPTLQQLYAVDIDKLAAKVAPRVRKGFRLQIVALLRKVAAERSNGVPVKGG